ncbi:hypothetical protein [Lentilactobacillus sunkii]|nr:hypothetical protein [Lentilactobacillus sunkii]
MAGGAKPVKSNHYLNCFGADEPGHGGRQTKNSNDATIIGIQLI